MIGQRFLEKKTAILDVWKRYKARSGASEDGVDPVFLEHRAKALEEERYVLAVVGEAKVGKSTLINALLGERILTTVTTLRQQRRDVLDFLTAACTTAIRKDPPPSLLPLTSPPLTAR